MERLIDIRSDTVTQPTAAMRTAMANALVGDDVYGDDPTVNELETLAAQMVGKEAAMFVPSGTMGNQICAMTHVKRGDEIILSDMSHMVQHEVGGLAILSGAMVRGLDFGGGLPDVEKIRKAIRGENIHYPETGMIEVECPLATGRLMPPALLKEIYELAQEHGIPVHMDGARLFNAATALGVDVKELTQYTDSVMFCLSKGLCAPVGSMVAGTREFIEKARKNRKTLGGGMRQAGILAAAGIIALRDMSKRLGEDHANARLMAQKLAELPDVEIDLNRVEINMVFFKINRSAEFNAVLPERLKEKGILINAEEEGEFRFVTNHDISVEDINRVISALTEIMA